MIMKTLTINGQTFIVVDADAMKKIADSDLDMNGRIIRNVLNGNEDTDSATVGQLNAAVGDIETAKLDKPETVPEVGDILKVKSVNEDGSFTCEWGRISVQNEPIHITLEEAVSQVNVDTSDFTVPINKCSKITVIFSLPATGTEYKFNPNITFKISQSVKNITVLITNANYGVTTVAANSPANVFVTIENKDGFVSSSMRYSHKASNLVQATYSNCCHLNMNDELSGENADSIIFSLSGAPAGTKISIYSEAEGGFEA